jgi:hypothetical protein
MKAIEKEFSQGVKILLERMENNPEDFVGSDDPERMYETPKFRIFADLMRDVVRGDKVKHWEDWYLLTKEEQAALIQGYKNMMRSKFDQGIMKRLLEEPEQPEMVKFGKKPYNLGNTLLTPASIANEALKVLEKEYSKTIDESVLKGNYTPTPKKFLLSPSQVALANKLGMSPADYAKKINAPKV